MLGSDLYFRNKIPVAVMGATGKIGQRFIQQLAYHPWFQIIALCDDLKLAVGQLYGTQCLNPAALPESLQNIIVQPCELPLPCALLFSFLPLAHAQAREKIWSEAGYQVVSSAFYHMSDRVPFICAELNGERLGLLYTSGNQGNVIANPNSLAIAVALALKPLLDRFGLDVVHVKPAFTEDENESDSKENELSAVCLDMEKEKNEIKRQILWLLGESQGKEWLKIAIEIDVHSPLNSREEQETLSVSIKLKKTASAEEVIQTWSQFKNEALRLPLPTAPYHPLYYFSNYLEKPNDKGMALSLNKLSCQSPLDYTFNISFSPLMRGCIGSMLLNAELLVVSGNIYW